MWGYDAGGFVDHYGEHNPGIVERGDAFSHNSHTASTTKSSNKGNCQATASDPVVVADGAKVLAVPLFSTPGEMGLKFSLYYHSETGSGVDNYEPWLSSIDYLLDTDCGFTNPSIACDQVTLYRPDGSSVSFTGNHASFGNFPEIGGGGLATLVHNTDGTWILHDEDATVQTYDSAGHLTSIKDASGIGWTISYTETTSTAATPSTAPPIHPCSVPAGGMHAMCTGPNPPPSGNVVTQTRVVTHTDGQSYTIVSKTSYTTTWASQSVTVTDPAGNQYTYHETGSQSSSGIWVFGLTSLTLPGTPATKITFSGSPTLLTGLAYNGIAYWATSYDSSDRVASDGAADGTERTSILYSTSSGGMVATITNPLGLTTTNTYTTDAQGNYMLTKVSNSAVQGCGATTSTLAWDGNDNETQSVDNDGVTHTYSYAANGQLQTETEAAGTAVARTTNYSWDPNQQLNRLLSITVPGESEISYTYNAQNRVATVTRTNLSGVGTPNQTLMTTYAYTLYANGMLQSMTVTAPSPNNADTATYQYDSHGNLTSVTDGLGHVTTYSGYNALGEVGTVVGPNGDETDFTYDARGRMATKTTHPNGIAATWDYTYDGFGLQASVTAPDGEVTTWTRDQEMRVTAITHNDKDGTATEAFTYDDNDDVTSDVVSRGGVVGKSTSYVYNALGDIYQVKGADGQSLTYAYDGNGNVLSVTDALGHATHFTYDALNRVATATDAAGGVTDYTYDTNDDLVQVTDPRGLVTTYRYDGFGQLLNQVSPDTGTTTLTYDAYGRLATTTRADGTQLSYAYDALNRLTSATAGSAARTYLWDSCTDGIGRLCADSSGATNVGYSYSPEGWITGRAFTFANGTGYSLGYSYDDMGQLATVDYPDGNAALYDYVDGSVADVRLNLNGANAYGVTGVTYQPGDLAMSGWTSYNGLANTITYDSDLRPTSISVPNVESLAFQYDSDDQITAITNGLNNAASQTLSYDADGRLNTVSGAQTTSYSYDADGNRTQQIINGTATTFTYATGSNQLIATSGGAGLASSYGYDANGNTVSLNGMTAYSYGPFNRLVNASGESFVIGAEGQRLQKAGATGTTYFAPDPSGALLAEDDAGNWHDNVWLNGRLVEVIAGGKVYSVASDQTGRPIVLTDPSTAVVWQATGLPFDRTVTTNTWGDFNIGFPGQYFDDEDNLLHNGYRDYDAAAGRYIESDPIGLAGGVNTYAYVKNNSISDIDPLGLGGPFGGYSFNEAEGIEVQQQVDQEESDLAPHGGGAGFSGAADATTLFSGQVSVAGAFLPNDVGLVGSEGVSNSTLGLYAGGGPFVFFTNATSRQQLSGCAQTTSYNTPFGSLQITTSGSTWVLSLGIGPSTGFSASSYSTYTAPLN